MSRLLDEATVFLRQSQVEAYLVGGYVRDLLRGGQSKDIDIAVAGDALALARQFADAVHGHFVPLDPVNNVARVVAADKHSHIDMSALRQNDLHVDLKARDFTFNALALPLGERGLSGLVDLSEGRKDLQAGRVRVVGESTFREDPVRLLRAVRFAAQLGFEIEERTQEVIRRDAALLAQTAAERVCDELAVVLASPGAWRNLRLLDSLGLLAVVLPELDALRGQQQPSQHHYDVFTHTLAVTDAMEETLLACDLVEPHKRPPGPPHPALPQSVLGAVAARVRPHLAQAVAADRGRIVALKLGALFHDVAKPQTRTDEAGEVHFYDHPAQGAVIAEAALRRLRFSAPEIRIVTTMVINHMRPAQIAADPQATQRAVYRFFRDTGAVGIDTVLLSLADHIGTRGPGLDPSAWWQHAQFTRLMLEFYFSQPETTPALPRLLSGRDLMREFGLPQGPRLGELLSELREAQAVGDVRTRDDALSFIRRLLVNGMK